MDLRKIDSLVAQHVMGWGEIIIDRNGNPVGMNPLYPTKFVCHIVPHYSASISDVWVIVDKLAPIVGDFKEADGFFKLEYADSADHSQDNNKKCTPGDCEEDDDGKDPSPWSAHFHPGIPGSGTESAKIFAGFNPDTWESKWFCAKGATAPIAICLAALKVYGVDTSEIEKG